MFQYSYVKITCLCLILIFGIVHLFFHYASWEVSSLAYHPYSSLPNISKTVKSYIFSISNQYMYYYDYGNIINMSHVKDESLSQHFIFLKLITYSLCFYLELQLVTLKFSKQNVNISYSVSFSYPKDMVPELWDLPLLPRLQCTSCHFPSSY